MIDLLNKIIIVDRLLGRFLFAFTYISIILSSYCSIEHFVFAHYTIKNDKNNLILPL